jgi:hypothetical protein
MFCPRCSQQQLSDEVRFCSRCGLPLAGVAALLAADGKLTGEKAPRDDGQHATRARLGAKMIFFGVFLTPIFFGLAVISDSPVPLFVPAIIFFTGLARVLYSKMFGEELLPFMSTRKRTQLREGSQTRVLGAPLFVPATGFSHQRVNTAEIAQPDSITDHTTTLLDKERH